MKVKVDIGSFREVEIPDEYFIKDSNGELCLTDDARNNFIGENSTLLKEGEVCVCAISTLDGETIAEW